MNRDSAEKAMVGSEGVETGAVVEPAEIAQIQRPGPRTTVNLILEYSGGLRFKQALINGVQVPLVGSQARFSVDADRPYRLEWAVLGWGGVKWSYKLKCETEGYEIEPKKLSDPGMSFTLQRADDCPPLEPFWVNAIAPGDAT